MPEGMPWSSIAKSPFLRKKVEPMMFDVKGLIAAIIVVDGSINLEQMLEASGLIDPDYLVDDFDMMIKEIQQDVRPKI